MLHGPRTTVARGDPLYPHRLLDLPDPPDVLHIAGDASVLDRLAVAVVGTRRVSPYGLQAVDDLVDIVANCRIPIVTGGTIGVAAAATEVALGRHVPAVAVLGSGLDMPYPTQHDALFQRIVDEGGAVVSEQPDGYPPRPAAFRRRNRIIAALAEAVLVVEAGVPSGTFSLCDTAAHLGRELYAVPGPIYGQGSRGCNALVADGSAKCIDCVERLAEYITNLRWERGAYD